MTIESLIKRLLVETRNTSFLVRSEFKNGRKVYVFHGVDGNAPADFAQQAQDWFATQGTKVHCEVRRHRSEALARLKSLEAINSAFGSGEIVYDPTHLAGRASALVQLAKSLRTAIPSVVSKIGFESRRRTLYVLLDDSRHARTADAVRETLQKAAAVVDAWRHFARPDFDLSVRVGFDAPLASTLVPVDAASATKKVRYMLARFGTRFARNLGLSVLLGLGVAPAAVAREPAVSQPNASIITKGGVVDDTEFGVVGAKGILPLGNSFGVQVEGGVGTDDYYGVGGHLFWRDPSVGLLGIYGTGESWDDVDMVRVGAEAEMYFNSFTLGGAGGHQSGDVDEGGFGRVDLKFYATPDFVLKAGGEYSPEMSLGRVGMEWRPAFGALPGLSVHADGEFGEDDSDSIMLGFSYHFGKKGASLIDRDRREDPAFGIFNMVQLHHARQAKQGYTPTL